MDVLKDKKSKSYDYISRYSGRPYYYHTLDNKYIYGLGKQYDDQTTYILHKIEQNETLDSLALKYYGRPDFYWIIADFNKIEDVFFDLKKLPYNTLKIPTISNLKYKQPRN